MQPLLAAALTAAAVLLSPAAQAREDMDANHFVKMADTNKDGMVSKEEAMKMVEKMFEKHDTKKAGKIDQKQVEQFLRELMKGGA